MHHLAASERDEVITPQHNTLQRLVEVESNTTTPHSVWEKWITTLQHNTLQCLRRLSYNTTTLTHLPVAGISGHRHCNTTTHLPASERDEKHTATQYVAGNSVRALPKQYNITDKLWQIPLWPPAVLPEVVNAPSITLYSVANRRTTLIEYYVTLATVELTS